MDILKKYKAVLLSGLLVIVFCVAAYCAVGKADSADSQYTYAEHIFQDDTVNEINIEIDEDDWQDMLDNPLEEEYHKANITINGETVGNVAIRTKGNNSLTSVANSDSDRYSFKIDFDYYDDNGNYYGLKKLCLNNNYSDNSSMREYISYKIMGELGLDVPGCGYSNITVNGEEWGLYLAVEAVDETFLATHFDDTTGDLYKPEGQEGTGADLVYDGDDISAYTGLNLKTNEKTSDGKEIIALMKALEDGENLEDVLDVEKALKYIAANVALANFDSYLGNTTHNYYLYEEDGYFTIIPWDMNLAFGGFGGGEVDIYEPTSQSMGGFGGGPGGDKKDDTQDNDAATNTTENTETQADNQQQPPDNGNMQGGGQQQPPDNANMQGGNQPQPPDNGDMQGGGQPNGGNQPQNSDNSNQTENSQSDKQNMGGNPPEMPDGMDGKNQPQGMPSMSSGEKPLVTTLLENDTYRSMYESYLKEIAEKYFTQEYMTAMVSKIHDLIAPYVQNDPTAFCTYEEFEQACSTDPTDQYSLVYYAVNMAESIETQLNGGEPTFNTSSMKGGGMGGGGKGGPDFGGEMPDMPQQSDENQTADAQAMNLTAETEQTEQETDAQQNTNDRPTPPDQNGGQNGGQMDENKQNGQQDGQANGQTDGQQNGQQGGPPDFGGGKGGNPPGMPGQENNSVSLSDCLLAIAVCGGVFVVGVVVLILFKRKKDLKPPKGN